MSPAAVTPRHAPPREVAIILGVPFDNLTLDETLQRVEEFVLSGRPHYVVTANVNFVVKAHQDPEFMEVVRMGDLITCDGMPLLWASRLLGAPLKERVTGSDLTPRLIELAARKGWGVFFLGGEPGVGEQAVARLRERFPQLRAHCYSPEYNPLLEMGNDKILAEIRAVRPQLLFVSLGAGKAEKWMRMNARRLDVPVCLGVGGTIDFLAGRVRRAPVFFQRSGLEWLWRLAMEPGRMWRRYAGDFLRFARIFVPHWLGHLATGRRPRRAGQGRVEARREPALEVLAVSGRLDAAAAPRLQEQARPVLDLENSLVLDLSGVEFLDSAGLGALVALEKEARGRGRKLVLLAPSAPVRRVVALARMEGFFALAESLDLARARAAEAADGRMQVKRHVLGSKLVTVALRGRIDADSSESLRESLLGLCDAPDIQGMDLDLGEVDFVDSSGLTTLILLRKKLDRQGRTLRVANVNGPVARIFALARMDKYLELGKAG